MDIATLEREQVAASAPPLVHSLASPQIVTAAASGDNEHHSSAIDKALRIAGISSAAISLSPFILKEMGVGKEEFDFLRWNCCPLIQKNAPTFLPTATGEETYGIAGAVAAALERIPHAGGQLSQGGIHNALAASGLIIAGHYGGLLAEKIGNHSAGAKRINRIMKNTGLALGVVVALPAVLPGVGHAVQFLTGVAGIDHIDMQNKAATGPGAVLSAWMGKVPGACKSEVKLTDGAVGSGSILFAQLCCALPALLASLPLVFSRYKKKEQGAER